MKNRLLLLFLIFIVSCEEAIIEPSALYFDDSLGEGEIGMIVPDDPMVWIPFDNSIEDKSDHEWHLYINEVELSDDKYGTPDYSIEFDRDDVRGEGTADDHIHIPHDNQFNEDNISLTAWVYPEYRPYNTSNVSYSIASRWDGGDNESTIFRFMINEDQFLTFTFGDNETGIQGSIRSSDIVDFNTWSHVAFTLNEGYYTFYINGEIVGEGHTDYQLVQGAGGLMLGEVWMSNGMWYFYDGKIDNFGYWVRSLTNDEITGLYNF